MTKKDYIKLAKMLKDVRDTSPTDASAFYIFDTIVARFQAVLQEDNPRFDPDKFADAIYR